jgi:glutathione S-transferase
MLKITGRKTSINVQRVMWAVAELGQEHTRVDAGGPFGGLDTPEFGALNPNRLVPVLEDKDLVLWESNPIVRYLCRSYGWGTLSPSDEHQRAKADQWMEWSNTTIYPDIIVNLFVPMIRVPARDRDMAAVTTAATRAGSKLTVLDGQLAGNDFILGDQLAMADIAAGALMYRYFTLPITRPKLVNVEAWYARLASRQAYKDHVMIEYESMKVPGA